MDLYVREIPYVALSQSIVARYGQVVDEYDRRQGLQLATIPQGEVGIVVKVLDEHNFLVVFDFEETSIIHFVLSETWLAPAFDEPEAA